MNHTARMPRFAGGKWAFIFAALVAWAIFLMFAVPVAAQDEKPEGTTQDATKVATGKASASGEDGCAVAQAGDLVVEAGCGEGEASGDGDGGGNEEEQDPLAGEEAEIIDSDDPDEIVNRVTIPGKGCKVDPDATVVVEDEDGTQVELTNGENVEITAANGQIEIEGTGENGNFNGLEPDGGNQQFDEGTGTVIESSGITCGGDGGGSGNGGNGGGGGGSGGGGSGGGSGNGNPDDPNQVQQEPQDKEKGPLAGGLARGKDILVPGDVIDVLPDGTEVVGIDQILIETRDCKLTAQGENLTVTLSDQGVPFRIRDGDNVDITLQQDGTLQANGRKTLGDSFPQSVKDNPDRLIIPIPVDPENDNFSRAPNDRFPIISSTGVGGEGCQAVKAANDSGGGDNNGNDDVIDNTVPDRDLPDTGGPGVVFSAAGLLIASGLLGVAVMRRKR